jgi:hypothetical protein
MVIKLWWNAPVLEIVTEKPVSALVLMGLPVERVKE